MGLCSSKLPTFPAPTEADGIAPPSPPSEFDSQLVKFIPTPGMLTGAIGVFLPRDVAPTYFFQPSGGSYKLYKVLDGGREEAAVITSGWQTSKGYDKTDTNGETYGYVTTSAKKTLTVSTKLNGQERKVKVLKSFKREFGSVVEFNEGYSISCSENEGQNRAELTSNGNVIAHVYDKAQMMAPMSQGPHGSDIQGISGLMKAGMSFMKAPMALYIKRTLLEAELVLALCIIATANDRLIRIASLDVHSANGAYHEGHEVNQHFNDGGAMFGDGGGGGDCDGGGE